MVMNLFSIFDPTTQIFSLKLNWCSLIFIFIFIPYPYWLTTNLYFSLIKFINFTLQKELSTLLGPTFFKGSTLILITLFLFILTLNMMGLTPYTFTPTSHPVLTISLALPLWLSNILFSWINFTNHMFAHLVPQGTPPMLMMFMVAIETISNLIRPLTLSVRLAANMIAGHLLLTLLGGQGEIIKSYMLPMMIFTQLLLLSLESAVEIIQAYVFIVLMTLYISETSYEQL